MRWLRLAGALALVVGVYFAVPISEGTDRGGLVRLGLAGTGVALLTALVVWQLRVSERPGRRVDGLLLALVVGVLGFALGYATLEQHDPGQVAGLETRLDALYFTMTTLLTIGYGDVHPAGQAARALA
ncbi:MAG TPA: potassium channel family protein, partial [Nocardioides sp.]|nr:potassium channel family protein [Nocardioides sp.]